MSKSLGLQNTRHWSEYPQSGELDWLDQIATREEKNQQRRSMSNREVIVDELRLLTTWASRKIQELRQGDRGYLKPLTELKYDLVLELCCVYQKYSPDKSLLAKDYSSKSPTPYVEFVRTAAAPILGNHDLLIDQIKEAKSRLPNVEKFDPDLGIFFF